MKQNDSAAKLSEVNTEPAISICIYRSEDVIEIPFSPAAFLRECGQQQLDMWGCDGSWPEATARDRSVAVGNRELEIDRWLWETES